MWLEHELKRHGFTISEKVATGEEAIASARKNNPDVVLMDVRLAGAIDGIDAAREIRSFSRAFILFTTGYADGGIKERALKVRNAGYLVKPFKIKDLLDAIESASDSCG